MRTGKRVWLIAGSRTAIGTYGKSLRSVGVDKLAEHVMTNAIRRAGISAGDIDGIILGHGYQSSLTPNTARFAALHAGLPASIPAMTVQRQCGSGMEAVNLAMKDIALGEGDIYLAGGVESMSTIPYLLPASLRFDRVAKKLPKFAARPVVMKIADDGLAPRSLVFDPESVYMSCTAQRIAETYGISRQEADKFSLRSQELAAEAVKSGRFAIEIDPIMVPGRGFFAADEHPRSTSLEKLSRLPRAFSVPKVNAITKHNPLLPPRPAKGLADPRDITAGNSSGINDGGCALILASEEKAVRLGLKPLACLVDSAVVGLDPNQMGLGPVLAIEKLLGRNNLSVDDVDLFEINEAFASQALGCEKLLGLDGSKVNVNGGAIALGHPIGMTGARLILTLAHELNRRGLKRGVASLCIGGGMGIATLIEVPDRQ